MHMHTNMHKYMLMHMHTRKPIEMKRIKNHRRYSRRKRGTCLEKWRCLDSRKMVAGIT